MKIGFEAKRVFRNFTGLGNYSRAVVRILAQQRPENSYYLYTPSQDNKISNSLKTEFPNISILEAPVKSLKSIWRILGITKDLKKDNLSIFHGLSNELPLNIRKSGVPSVVTIHDLIFLRYPQYYKFIDRKIYEYKFKKACKNSNRIIAISQQTKNDIVDLFKINSDKIDVVYQGCDPVFAIQKSEEEKNSVKKNYQLPENFLLCVGTIETRKNQLLIVKALAHLPQNINLVIVGRPTRYKTEILDFLSQNKQLAKRVLFLEKVPFEDLPTIYQCSSIFVYPSRIEGFGIPIVEALQSKIPVIGATGSCLEEAGGPNSIYIHPDNEIELADAISKINGDDILRQEIIAKGLEYAKNFSDESIAENLMKVYHKTLKMLRDEINKALEVLKNGGLILYPTDTIWGIGCDATNKEAVEKVYALKQRTESKSLIVLVDNDSKLLSYVREVPEIAYDLIEYAEHPLTIIYSNAKNLAENAINEDGSIGIRVTSHAFCKELIQRFRKPIVSTSANISGQKSPANFSEIDEEIINGVDYVVDFEQQDLTIKKPSTIMKLEPDGKFAFIRK